MSANKLATLEDDTTSSTLQPTITAVDIVLEPNEAMIQHAKPPTQGFLRMFPRATRWATNTRRTSRSWEGMSTRPAWTNVSSGVTSGRE
jgi:hypothetical protein